MKKTIVQNSDAFNELSVKEMHRLKGGLAILPFLLGRELGKKLANTFDSIFTPDET